MAKKVHHPVFMECQPAILEQLWERIKSTTPDFMELKKEDHIPVFVYGTLMKDHPNHGLLKDAPYLGRGVTILDHFQMRNCNNYFPVAMRMNVTGNHASIRGEVYVVDVKTILELDDLENNGVMYSRSKVHITLLDQLVKGSSRKGHPTIPCWTYLGIDEYWKSRNLPIIGSVKPNGAKKATVSWKINQSPDYGYNH